MAKAASPPAGVKFKIRATSADERMTWGVMDPGRATAEETEHAAWEFLARGVTALPLVGSPEIRGTVVESGVARQPFRLGGGPIAKAGDWFLTLVWPKEAWSQVSERGELLLAMEESA